MSAPGTTQSSQGGSIPERPRLVFRLGFAGRRELTTAESARLDAALQSVLETVGQQLAAIAPVGPASVEAKLRVSQYFSPQCPLLRLVTGLCEGADTVAAQALARLDVSPRGAGNHGHPCLETELAAVLPFDIESYRASRPPGHQAEFDRQLSRCAWVLSLDGTYDKPTELDIAGTTPERQRERLALASGRRARAYRARSAFILRHCDLLIAAADLSVAGRAGGTLEAVREAQVFETPVVFIDTASGEVCLLEPHEDLHDVRTASRNGDTDRWRLHLRNWVLQLTAAPENPLDLGPSAAPHDRGAGLDALLREYFDQPDSPPVGRNGRPKWYFRASAWTWFEARFRSGPDPRSDAALEPFAGYRKRATALNYHYSGLYRGTFLLNYALAVLAVALAAFSLVLLGRTAHTGAGQQLAALAEAGGRYQVAIDMLAEPPFWLLPTLLCLAMLKLVILFFISRNTRRANREHWNDRAVDYRYLAERLRGMFYLPLAGSHQPPAAAPPQFASRVVRQSSVDWLFDSLVRAVSPAQLVAAAPKSVVAHDGRGSIEVRRHLTIDALECVAQVRDRWVVEQAKYHARNSRTMHALQHAAETAGEYLGWTVIGVVTVDLLIVVAEVLHLVPVAWEAVARSATPWLVFVSTVLPAVVAALGGIRFQSECQRLAERSAVMAVMLVGRQLASGHVELVPSGGRWQMLQTMASRIEEARADPEADPGSWAHASLAVTELVATDFVQEAAEWSVLYAKEISDPG